MSRKFGRILSMIMFLFLAVGLIPSNVAQALIINKGDYTGYEFVHDINQGSGIMPAMKYDSSGNVVYCMHIAKQTPGGQDFSEGQELDDVAYRILKYGYPNTSITGNVYTDYFITQSAFWCYVDSGQANIGLFRARKAGNIGVEDTRVTQAVRDLLNKALSGTESKNISVNFSQDNIVATYDGSNYVTPYFRINVTGVTNKAKFRMEMKSIVNGIKYQLENGNYVSEIPMNTNFRVIIPGTAKEGEVSLRALGQVSGTKVTVYKSPNPQIQDVAKWRAIATDEQTRDYANITWNVKGGLEVIKKGDNGELLDGAKFELRKEDGTAVATQVTVGGRATFTDIDSGNYVLAEVEAPVGYVISGEPKNITITSGNTTTVEVVNNVIKGKVKVIKKDAETGELLKGAEFELVNKETGKTVETLITGDDGTATSSLHHYGEYILRETKAPNKYTLNGKEYPVTINENIQIIEVNVTNTIIKGRVSIEKVDSDMPTLKLEGAEFTIYDANGDVVDTLVTREDGTATSKLLKYGTYKMRETKAPSGYSLSDKEWTIEISENNKTYKYTIENEIIKGKIKVVKVDEDTETPLAGAKFDVYAKNVQGIERGTLVETIVTGIDGTATTVNLRKGTYVIMETKAPDGYILDKSTFELNIESSKVVEKVVSNKILEGKVKIIKTDEEGTLLNGAVFGLYSDKSCNNLITKATSDGNGVLEFTNLRAGENYYIKELKAPNGYRIPVDEDGNIHVYTLTFDKTGNSFTVDDVLYEAVDKGMSMSVVNYKAIKLPITGSYIIIPLVLLGVGLMSYSLYTKKNNKNTSNKNIN